MFGRRKREKRLTEEAAREAERRALFEELAKRPDTVCPFLGLAQARAEYHPDVSEDHRCYAFGDPAELSSEQQHKVCLQRGYGNCPRYLRGVLVIPTEELEALRRPLPPALRQPSPPPPASPSPASDSGRGRRGLAAIVLVLLLLVSVGGAAFVLLGNGGVANQSPSPSPVASLPTTPSPSAEPSTAVSTAPSPTPDPTPAPEDVFQFFEVSVQPGVLYVLYEVEETSGAVVNSREAEFENSSQAKVECLTRSGEADYWRTLEGEYAGPPALSYIHEASGPFRIRAVYRTPDGSRSSEFVPNDEVCPS